MQPTSRNSKPGCQLVWDDTACDKRRCCKSMSQMQAMAMAIFWYSVGCFERAENLTFQNFREIAQAASEISGERPLHMMPGTKFTLPHVGGDQYASDRLDDLVPGVGAVPDRRASARTSARQSVSSRQCRCLEFLASHYRSHARGDLATQRSHRTL